MDLAEAICLQIDTSNREINEITTSSNDIGLKQVKITLSDGEVFQAGSDSTAADSVTIKTVSYTGAENTGKKFMGFKSLVFPDEAIQTL